MKVVAGFRRFPEGKLRLVELANYFCWKQMNPDKVACNFDKHHLWFYLFTFVFA